MPSITPCTSQTEISSWTKINQEKIQSHPAWQEGIDAEGAETLLQGNASLTYLLREGEGENAYFITYVKEDLTIRHQRFTLEYDRRGWFYKNGGYSSLSEIVSETLEGLIPRMMYCDPAACKVVNSYA